MIKVVNLQDLPKFASEFSSLLRAGDVVLLNGDLGAGKTTFTKAVFASLKVKEMVTSPTFSILKTYHGKYTLHHFDAYRITTDEALEAGFDEIIEEKSSVKFIEWGENIKELIPKNAVIVNITKIDENARKFEIIK